MATRVPEPGLEPSPPDDEESNHCDRTSLPDPSDCNGKPAPSTLGRSAQGDARQIDDLDLQIDRQAHDHEASCTREQQEQGGEEEEQKNLELVLRARQVSIVSLFASLFVAGLGLGIGLAEAVLSLVGFGLEALLDGISSALVLWRFKTPKQRQYADHEAAQDAKLFRDAKREHNSAIGIGVTFCSSGCLLLLSAAYKLLSWDPRDEEHMHEERTGAFFSALLAWPSTIIFGFLAYMKFSLSQSLASQVLRKDAMCSMLGAALAFICALASWAEQTEDSNPTTMVLVDVIAGGLIALILVVEGGRTLRENVWDESWATQHQQMA